MSDEIIGKIIGLGFFSAVVSIIVGVTAWNFTEVIKKSPESLKKFLYSWIFIWLAGIISFLVYLFLPNKFFLLSFCAVFPITGILLFIYPAQFSELMKMTYSQKPLSYVYSQPPVFTTLYIRLMGLIFIIFGLIFLTSIGNNSVAP